MPVAVLIGPGEGSGVGRSAVRVVEHVATRLVALHIAGVGIAVAVAVAIGVPGRGVDRAVFIDLVVAVVVVPVAVLGGTRIGGDVVGSTVGVVGDVACGLVAVDIVGVGVAIAVIVAVCVPGQHIHRVVFVNIVVAVVVMPVAVLISTGKGARIRWSAVRVVEDVAARLIALHIAGVGIAVGVAVLIGVPGQRVHSIVFIDAAVAVIIVAVAVLVSA